MHNTYAPQLTEIVSCLQDLFSRDGLLLRIGGREGWDLFQMYSVLVAGNETDTRAFACDVRQWHGMLGVN